MTLLERLGVELGIVQAGMGGGIAGHELAAAVSGAGGLGTVGMAAPRELERELAAVRERTSRPVAVNVLLPFARRGHWRAAAAADVVVTFWGRSQRRVDVPWVHQCGSVEEAQEAADAGADGVIVQGVEAGGHVRGTEPAHDLLARIRKALPEMPLWLAGGIADAGDVRRALRGGAEAAVLGTRFVMTNESRAHPEYKARLQAAQETELTELFGTGWPARHRVIRNAAVERWGAGPAWMHAVNRVTAPVLRAVPPELATRSPLPAPLPPVAGADERLVDAGPLYAGETVARIGDIRPAGELTRELASGTPGSP
jgi:nitronate monooxygenase